ncbi:hypothetical protein [Proteiniphilum saccharofermentans]|uniref:hypothetical protein n=1 Tax=Proteiniphilum saccharofermentans TaxID=1642647 RepID=UPI0028AEF64D|nr:hypothetical protein [Proteiniphilum saccharofermentans]
MRVYKSYPYCFSIKGDGCCAIFNSQFETIQLVPFAIAEIFEALIDNTSELCCIQKKLAIDSTTLNICIDYLKEKKYVFVADSSDLFPQIELYDTSTLNIFKNAVIEFNDKSDHIERLGAFVSSYPFEFLELRFLPCVTDVNRLLNIFTDRISLSTIRAIQIVMSNKCEIDLRSKLLGRITHVIKYGANSDSSIQSRSGVMTYYVKDKYNLLCGRNNDYNKNLVIDLDYFIKSHFINPYYYGRIEIDSSGFVKNSLKNPKSFGNISSNNLYDIIHRSEFQKMWFITHDMIREIKGSPLRYNMFVTNNLDYDEVDKIYRFSQETGF